ncbi:MAG: hydrogenase expression/formation protein HypE [Phycisphaerae bacterium]|nr:hydrogenase expression/formation protein HypE [Phycisphaerae bacterium]
MTTEVTSIGPTPPREAEIPRIVRAHGGGGELMGRLIRDHLLPVIGNDCLSALGDGAVLPVLDGVPVMTTDGFVVQPLTFPGGDIGRLAVCGTVNDLAMMGARPVALSLAMILEEGLPMATLDWIVASISAAADEAGVRIVTGDTKVVESSGRTPGMTITTAGIGVRAPSVNLGPGQIRPGDRVLINGTLAEHGLAIMAAREGLEFETELTSDAAPLNGLVAEIMRFGDAIRFLRDPTRGGLANVLADVAEETGLGVEIEESALPIRRSARHAAELLGLDPLTVANEGKCVIVVAEDAAEEALAVCRQHRYGRDAAVIGRVTDSCPAVVELLTTVGGRRIVQRPYGEELPRIC